MSNIFITGITGTLGTAIAKCHRKLGDAVYGCARNEHRAVEWKADESGPLARLIVADARDLEHPRTIIGQLLPNMAKLYHCAAMKHVDLCHEMPVEACQQNIDLTARVSAACANAGVPFTLISSDKACLPQSVYGATKLIAERIALGNGGAVVRLGNLIGSSGSVFQTWAKAVTDGRPIVLTDPECTRFFITVKDAAEFAVNHCRIGQITASQMRSARLGSVANALRGMQPSGVMQVGLRPGETLHQWLIAPDENIILKDSEGQALEVNPQGLCSERAYRWPTQAILQAAGVLL